MKYFLDIDTCFLHSVPKKHQYLLDIITDDNDNYEDWEVNEAKNKIVKKCKVKLRVDVMTQTL